MGVKVMELPRCIDCGILLQLSKPGRLPDTSVPTIENGTPVADFCWDPFDLQRLAVGA